MEIWEEEHKVGDLHYHIETYLDQKDFFLKLKKKLPELLPEGFKIVTYKSQYNMGILDNRNIQHIYISYNESTYHNRVLLSFLKESFKPIFIKILHKCFPEDKISWRELGNQQKLQIIA